MQCPECNIDNPEGAKFCFNCGAKLAAVCPQCGATLPPQAKFCFECGSVVAAPAVQAERDTQAMLSHAVQRLIPKEFAERLLATRSQVGHERRMVTILMSDVKGSTAMAEDMDPEEVMEIMSGAFDVLIEPIYRYEGTLARLMGDAILAFFGAPIAHEDDPERAIRAALDIVQGAGEYAARLEEERGISGFNVRVGINTGLVVVGEVGSDLRVEYTAMGDAVNLAARMESAAEPGTILITEDTHKFIAPLFETDSLGQKQVKGKAEPVSVYRVLASKMVPGKMRGVAGLESPLVGREAEFRTLQEAVERLQAGVGGIVTIVGEAGIGKSRLVAELREQASADLQWIEGRCLSYGTSIAYLLWLDVLRSVLGVSVEDSPVAVGDGLRQSVENLCPEQFDDIYPYLGRLMSLPLEAEGEARIRDLEGERLKAGTFRAVERLVEGATREGPLVIVCEDLHWADSISVELLEQLLALTERASLLLVCVFRPRTGHGCWRIKETAARLYRHCHTDVWLDPLSAAESEMLVGNLLRIEDLPPKLKWRILSRAEGNPFYVEEVIRSLIDSEAIVRDEASGRWQATQDVSSIPIPDTLHGVLIARIDRLQEEAKRVLQLAAVIGRIFLRRVLVAIAQEERELDGHLITLQREEMIRERARLPELEYIFKHELTREAAYNGLLKKQRRVFHRQVAEALERLSPDRIEEQVGLLAHHWERAGDADKATEYLLRAGDQARRAYASQEAIDYYRRALALLEASAADESRADWQLQMATQLHESLGDVLALTGRYDEARSAYQGALAQVPKGDPIWQARLHRRIGTAWDEQNRHEEASEAYDIAEITLGEEPAESALDWWQEWLEIQHRQIWLCYGLNRLQEMVELAGRTRPVVEKYGTPFQRGGFFQGLTLLGLRKDRYLVSEETVAYARASLEAFRESGNLSAATLAQSGLGFTLLWRGELDEAEKHMLAGLRQAERIGDVAVQSRNLTYLTMLHRRRGQIKDVKYYVSRSMAVATARQMLEYIGMAKANLAWVAWREGNLSAAQDNGRVALETWQQAPLASPFQWAALWPLMAVAMTQNRVSEAIDHARVLLEPSQQRLPDALAGMIQKAVVTWEGGRSEMAHAHLSRAIELVQELGYL